MISTREAFGRALAEFGADPRVYVLDSDLACCTMSKYFQEMYQDRFFNVGVAEGNMIGVAAGIATTGKTVFACSFAMFSAGRAWERVRNSVAYPRLNVRVVGSHGGISVGEDGPTHQATEDIAIMRAIPNMMVLCPADAVETRETVRALLAHDGPAYLRLGRSPVEIINDRPDYEFKLGKGVVCRPGEDVALVCTGQMVQESLAASRLLEQVGISAQVINLHTIKPLDQQLLLEVSREKRMIVTVEDHNVIGGLGSAVAEYLAEWNPVKVVRIGINDVFGHSGEASQLRKLYGIDAEGIAARVRKELDARHE